MRGEKPESVNGMTIQNSATAIIKKQEKKLVHETLMTSKNDDDMIINKNKTVSAY